MLRSRSGRLYHPGDEEWFWVFGVKPETRLLYLSDSDYGRLPISDRMRPRYVKALRAVLHLIRGTGDASSDQLSEAKGMLGRCIRKDQWDWLTVYECLGRPSVGEIHRGRDALGHMAREARGADTSSTRARPRLEYLAGLEGAFEGALRRLVEGASRIPAVATFRPVTESSTDEAPLSQAEPDEDRYIVSQTARVKQERGNTRHQETLGVLSQLLQAEGFVVESSRLVDAFCRLKTGPAIFEVKSITPENERSQCRHALSQLYEYRYLHSIPEASLWIVLSDPPYQAWLSDYLQADRGIGVLWVQDESLTGPGVRRLLSSGFEDKGRDASGEPASPAPDRPAY